MMKIPSDGGDRPKAKGGFNSGKLSQLGTHPHPSADVSRIRLLTDDPSVGGNFLRRNS
jgi:hypothetical protein